MKFKLLLIFISIYNISISQIPDLSNWKLDSRPKEEDRNNIIHMSDFDWRFLKSGDRWEIVKHEKKWNDEFNYNRGDSLPFTSEYIEKNFKTDPWHRFIKKIPGGYLVGVWLAGPNGLYFISEDGLIGYKMPGYLLISQIFEYNGKFYAIDGDFTGKSGEILEIYKKGNVWTYKKVAKTTPPTSLVTVYKKEMVGITASSIIKFGKDLKPKEVLKSPYFWGMQFPFSMLVNNDDLYIAMKGGVLIIKTFDTKPSYEWWVPK